MSEHIDSLSSPSPLFRLRELQSPQDRAQIAKLERISSTYLRLERDELFAANLKFVCDGLTTREDPNADLSGENRGEARALVVVGASGAGKTRLLTRHFSRHPGFPGYGVPSANCPLVSVTVPSPCSLKQLGRVILEALGYPLERDLREYMIWDLVRRRLKEMGILILHLDEAQHVTQMANVIERTKLLNTFKGFLLSKEWRTALIVSGLPEVATFMSLDPQVRRRSRFMRLSALSLPDDNQTIFDMTCALAGKGEIGVLEGAISDLVPRLIHAANYQLGTAIEMITEAIGVALERESEQLGRHHFGDMYAGRTGCVAPANPFLAADWSEIDCTKSLQTGDGIDPLPALLQPKRRRKAGSRVH